MRTILLCSKPLAPNGVDKTYINSYSVDRTALKAMIFPLQKFDGLKTINISIRVSSVTHSPREIS